MQFAVMTISSIDVSLAQLYIVMSTVQFFHHSNLSIVSDISDESATFGLWSPICFGWFTILSQEMVVHLKLP